MERPNLGGKHHSADAGELVECRKNAGADCRTLIGQDPGHLLKSGNHLWIGSQVRLMKMPHEADAQSV